MSGRRPQAKDVGDAEFLAVVDRLATTDRPWVMRWQVEDEYPDLPWKVLLAKARTLIRRGLLGGCACGCRGDYVVTPAGHAFLSPDPPPS